jgi:hypothetical protein
MSPKKLIPFKSSGKTTDVVIDSGTMDSLNYEVYKRGNIHIFDKKVCFKKDTAIFEDELTKIDFDSMKNGDEHLIKGCGDSDNLIIKCINNELKLVLCKRGNALVEKLKSVLQKNRK